jgi:hypothetical protein
MHSVTSDLAKRRKELISEILAAADGTPSATEGALRRLSQRAVADVAMDEVLTRSVLSQRPQSPVPVQFSLEAEEETLKYSMVLGPESTELHNEADSEPRVEIRQELAEFVKAIFGPAGRDYSATRSVTISSEPGPASDDPDDPWILELREATIAAGMAVTACSRYRPDLGSLARAFGSDKWGDHFFTDHYERHFAPIRDERLKILEIGVGGFDLPDRGGESLRMWKHFFPRALIYGLDIYDKSPHDEARIQTLVGDQSDLAQLQEITEEHGPFDVIIDDGSHLSAHVIASFEALFPLLAAGGVYVIEDLQTSYWTGWNGGRTSANDPATSVGYLKTLLDALHHQDHSLSNIPKPSIARQIRALHLYHNLAFVEKGLNAEATAPSWVRRGISDMDLEPKGSMRRLEANGHEGCR